MKINLLKLEKNKEEIKKFMDEAAIAKAKYRDKREIKFNFDNIIKEYEKAFKTDKTADELIKEQDQSEQNKDNRINEFININLTYKNNLPKNTNINTNILNSSSQNNTFKNSNSNIYLNNQNNSQITKNNVDTSNTGGLETNKISGKFPNCFTNINNKVIYSKIENKDDFNKKEEEIQKQEEINQIEENKGE